MNLISSVLCIFLKLLNQLSQLINLSDKGLEFGVFKWLSKADQVINNLEVKVSD